MSPVNIDLNRSIDSIIQHLSHIFVSGLPFLVFANDGRGADALNFSGGVVCKIDKSRFAKNSHNLILIL